MADEEIKTDVKPTEQVVGGDDQQGKPAVKAEPKGGSVDWKTRFEQAEKSANEAKADADKWKGLSRKHERRQLEALGFDAETAEKILAEQKKNPKAVADKVAGYDDLAARIKDLETSTQQANAEAAVAKAVSKFHVSDADAPLLDGLGGDALESLAKRLGEDNKKTPSAPNLNGAGKVGEPVSGPKQIATREEYAALSREERRTARQDGRLNQLLGIKS